MTETSGLWVWKLSEKLGGADALRMVVLVLPKLRAPWF